MFFALEKQVFYPANLKKLNKKLRQIGRPLCGRPTLKRKPVLRNDVQKVESSSWIGFATMKITGLTSAHF